MNSDSQQSPFPLELFKEIHAQSQYIPISSKEELATTVRKLASIIEDRYLLGVKGRFVKDDCILLCGMLIKLYNLVDTTDNHESSSDRQPSR